MKEIPLTRGYIALVDDEDFERVNASKWHLSSGYAAHSAWINKRPVTVLMHRLIMGEAESVDHRNRNPLDNRKANLRVATKAENMRNRNQTVSNSTGWKGVCWDKAKRKYKAQIKVNYRTVNLGRFNDSMEAAKAYNAAVIQHFGEFTLLNAL